MEYSIYSVHTYLSMPSISSMVQASRPSLNNKTILYPMRRNCSGWGLARLYRRPSPRVLASAAFVSSFFETTYYLPLSASLRAAFYASWATLAPTIDSSFCGLGLGVLGVWFRHSGSFSFGFALWRFGLRGHTAC